MDPQVTALSEVPRTRRTLDCRGAGYVEYLVLVATFMPFLVYADACKGWHAFIFQKRASSVMTGSP